MQLYKMFKNIWFSMVLPIKYDPCGGIGISLCVDPWMAGSDLSGSATSTWEENTSQRY